MIARLIIGREYRFWNTSFCSRSLRFLALILGGDLCARMARAAAAAAAAKAIFCEIASERPPRREAPIPRVRSVGPVPDGGNKIVLQPRLCTLRSYGSGSRGRLVRAPRGDDPSSFFASLADYIESSQKSHDFEIVSGRLAMVAFAAAVSVEVVTGNSLFKKLDMQQIAEAAGLCVAVVACAAAFAWFSSARNRIGQIFTLGCNTFVDSLIDNLVEALFYEGELSDWSDEI